MSRRKGVVLISALSGADRRRVVEKEETQIENIVSTALVIPDDWYCHCCRSRNNGNYIHKLKHSPMLSLTHSLAH